MIFLWALALVILSFPKCFKCLVFEVLTEHTVWYFSFFIEESFLMASEKLIKVLDDIMIKIISVPKCLSRGVLWQIYPLHDNTCLEDLQKTWVKKLFGLQPLGK